MIAPYPWQAEHWSQVGRNLAAGRLPHALLLHGRAGVGKRDFALQLAALLLCEARVQNDTVCGACRGCHLFKAGTHPDFRLLTPLDSGIVGSWIASVMAPSFSTDMTNDCSLNATANLTSLNPLRPFRLC